MSQSGPQVVENQTEEQADFLFTISFRAILYGSSCMARYQQYLSIVKEVEESGLFSEKELPKVIEWTRWQLLGHKK